MSAYVSVTTPSNAVIGDYYLDQTNQIMYVFDGRKWVSTTPEVAKSANETQAYPTTTLPTVRNFCSVCDTTFDSNQPEYKCKDCVGI